MTEYEWYGVYDAEGNEVDDPDMGLGRIAEETVTVHHEAVEEIEEVGHEGKVIAEYPNGGRDVEWVVDVQGVEGREAYDESVTIYRHTPYTEDELAEIAAQRAEAEAEAAYMGQLRTAASFAVASLSLDDDRAMAVSMLYPSWGEGERCEAGDIRRYGGVLYRCLQAHDAQASRAPDAAPSLWKRIGEPDPSGAFPWVQPLGATDAYAKGDRVTHGGKAWVSDIDANVWEPGVFGWSEEA